jgi:anti-sigma-K factor RskA
MDIKAYLQSGILEQYVLGLLSDEESQEVERLADQHPEIKAELNAIEDALATYAQNEAVPLSEGLPEQIMARVAASDKTAPPSGTSSSNWPLWLAALIALGLGIIAYLNYQSSQTYQQNWQDAQAQLDTLQENCDQRSQRIQTLEGQIAILRNPDYRLIQMNSVQEGVEAIASVYYNTEEEKSYLDLSALPELPSGKQYQLWAIVAAGPVDMGVFNLPEDIYSIFEVQHIPDAVAFAITVEDEGGVDQPTMSEMIVLGNVS